MDLIENLTKQLGISSDQAEQGAGLLFQKLKDGIGTDDFSKLTESIPDIGRFIDSAPKEDAAGGGGLMGMIGSAASNFGLDKVGNMADLAAGFDKLGLDTSQLSGFVTVVLAFIEEKVGVDAKSMLEKYLG